MCNKINILMTGAGAPGGPGILEALSKSTYLNVITADANPRASGRYLSSNFKEIPKALDNNFKDYLLDLCKAENIKLIFPLVTLELFVLSKFRDEFLENGIEVLVSDYGALSAMNDKGALLKHLKECNLPCPEFEVVSDKEGLVRAVENLGYPTDTVVIKPCIGNGSRGIRVLDPKKDAYELLFNEKPNSLFSKLDFVLEAIGDNSIPEMVVSEYMPGEELTIDTVVFDGDVKELLIRSRDTMNSGISTAGRFVCNTEVETYIKNIINSFEGLRGSIGFQVKKASNGEYLLLESNPRIQGTSVAALGCGINFPLLAVHEALSLPLAQTKLDRNVGFCRYYKEVFYEY